MAFSEDQNTIRPPALLETEDGETYELSAAEEVYLVTAPGAQETASLTLPPVSEMRKRQMSIYIEGGAGNVDLDDRADSPADAFPINQTMVDGDQTRVEGDGRSLVVTYTTVT